MRLIATLSLLASLSAVPVAASATTLFTDGFQAGGVNQPSIYSDTGSVGNFNIVVPTNVDFLTGSGAFGNLCTPAYTSNCVDLGGSSNNSNAMGVISSDITFAPGSYLVTFLLTGSGRGSTTVTDVSLGSYTFAPITLASGDTDSVSAYITTTTSGTLTFADADISGDPNIGAVLDSVTVSNVTPEPSSLILLGTGALSMAGLVRRKFRGTV